MVILNWTYIPLAGLRLELLYPPMLTLKEADNPPLQYPKITCDDPLHKKLDKIALTRNMNRSFAAAIIGPPGSGKTSLTQALIATPAYFQKVFHKIYLFMPVGSRRSVKDSVFDSLPDDQLFEHVTVGELTSIQQKAEMMAKKKKKESTLIIFDDVQDQFGSQHSPVYEKLLNVMANRRHAKISLIILCQNYGKLPKKCRQLLTDMFIFNPSKNDMDAIFEEHSKLPPAISDQILNMYTARIREEASLREQGLPSEKSFLYINEPNEKTFLNFQEIEIPDPTNIDQAIKLERRGRKRKKSSKEDDDKEDEDEEERKKKIVKL